MLYTIVLILGLTLLANAINLRIIGGYNVGIMQHPYVVSIEERQLGPICGGALIAPNLVLTAAHCLEKSPDFYSIRAGTSMRKYSGLIVDVLNYIYHDKFRFGESEEDYDICVIQTVIAFPLTASIQAIQLTDSDTIYPVKFEAAVAGWGTQYEDYDAPHILKNIIVESVPHEECLDSYKTLGKIVTNRMMCFGMEDRGFCKGDDGSALVESNKLIGIASWSVGCGRASYPGVFIDIGNPSIHDFIQDCLTKFAVSDE